MPAVDGLVRFYVDESALGIGKTLAAARKDVVHVGHKLVPECPLGARDTLWMPAVAQRGWVAIGRDKRIRTRPAEQQSIIDSRLRVFRIGGKKDQSTWEWLGLIHRNWHRMEEISAERPEGPWFYLINTNSLQEVPLGGLRRS